MESGQNCKSHKNEDFTLSKIWSNPNIIIYLFFLWQSLLPEFLDDLRFSLKKSLGLLHWWCSFYKGAITNQTGWYCTLPTGDENFITCHTDNFSLLLAVFCFVDGHMNVFESQVLDIIGVITHAVFFVTVTAVFYLEIKREEETVTVCVIQQLKT